MNVENLKTSNNFGNTISFKVTHPTDVAPIVGILVGFADARGAMLVSPIAHYHRLIETKRVSDGLPIIGDVNGLFFIILERDGGKRHAYALDWIDADGYSVVSSTQDIEIKLRNVTQADVAAVLAVIQSMNISAKVMV